jgi:hypothetical protein
LQLGPQMTHPYAVPTRLSPDLVRVQAYWKGLLRGAADMPFWDDIKLTDLADLQDRLVLIDVFDSPERFRLNSVGWAIGEGAVTGKFIDEMKLAWPFEFLRSQCSATVECAAATHFRRERDGRSPSAQAYSRLLLPLWGEGHIAMLLGAVDFP